MWCLQKCKSPPKRAVSPCSIRSSCPSPVRHTPEGVCVGCAPSLLPGVLFRLLPVQRLPPSAARAWPVAARLARPVLQGATAYAVQPRQPWQWLTLRRAVGARAFPARCVLRASFCAYQEVARCHRCAPVVVARLRAGQTSYRPSAPATHPATTRLAPVDAGDRPGSAVDRARDAVSCAVLTLEHRRTVKPGCAACCVGEQDAKDLLQCERAFNHLFGHGISQGAIVNPAR